MERIPEPELMDETEQARAYAHADFEAPHSYFIERFVRHFPEGVPGGRVLDLGCGPGDISMRFARAYPEVQVDGIDGAGAMLAEGRTLLAQAGLEGRVSLVHACLPQDPAPRERYDAIISNSLLHHLYDPQVLWQAVARYAAPGAPVFVMDLMRPDTPEQAAALVAEHAAGEPEVLRRDFYHSLLAAFTPLEVRAQLAAAGLQGLSVEAISDRHLLVHGRLREAGP